MFDSVKGGSAPGGPRPLRHPLRVPDTLFWSSRLAGPERVRRRCGRPGRWRPNSARFRVSRMWRWLRP